MCISFTATFVIRIYMHIYAYLKNYSAVQKLVPYRNTLQDMVNPEKRVCLAIITYLYDGASPHIELKVKKLLDVILRKIV